MFGSLLAVGSFSILGYLAVVGVICDACIVGLGFFYKLLLGFSFLYLLWDVGLGFPYCTCWVGKDFFDVGDVLLFELKLLIGYLIIYYA
ncbi:hypothetical protein M6B38_379850 [Iris pallida]|uniref:Uncharacterized protein n=1 Tax=Iris pallida TaxID=29817 RepID=A0AAX6G8R7_IRIPA|nr:hypothetical protein M6B38_379850 [Iris pallida]